MRKIKSFIFLFGVLLAFAVSTTMFDHLNTQVPGDKVEMSIDQIDNLFAGEVILGEGAAFNYWKRNCSHCHTYFVSGLECAGVPPGDDAIQVSPVLRQDQIDALLAYTINLKKNEREAIGLSCTYCPFILSC